jgi:hypothetical protein
VANAAGSAFMELQLYPPGYTPFVDSESCSVTKWCAALTIDSLECNFNLVTCNPNCEEPVNFAFLQNNGVPTGPPSPQLADVSSFLPNANTLLINPGDVVAISITDPPQGLTTVIRDLTTRQTGYMTASAANGLMNTSISTCDGTPFTFHAEYNTASINNRVPWAALEGGVLMEQEVGHSEVCNSLKYQDPFSASYPGGQSFADSYTYDTCVGGSEGPGCVVPPTSADFYPFWSLSRSFSALGSFTTGCVWNFGNNLPTTIANLGGDAQYGVPDLSWYGGTNISPVMHKPQFSGECAAR